MTTIVTQRLFAKLRGSAEFVLFELCGPSLGEAADFLGSESLRYPFFVWLRGDV
jgi:hypothetical protein